MELVEGPTLEDRIEAGPIPLDEAIPIVRQIVDALEYAHEKGIVHRDLKPANVKSGFAILFSFLQPVHTAGL
jgi:eukaryotic-like serine/threonine-protein kinase